MGNKIINGNVKITGKLNPNASGYGISIPDTSSLTTGDKTIAADEDVVHNTGNETITGQKTFTSSPIIKDCGGGLVVEETDGTFLTEYIEYQADGVRILYDPSSSQYPTILKFPVVNTSSFIPETRTLATQEWVNTNAKNLEEITWSNLKNKRDNSQLIPGRFYRITDYQCTTSYFSTIAADHQFDIIVTADSTNTLNESAKAIKHTGDTYFALNKLEAWDLKYCLDNDVSRFWWACPGRTEYIFTSKSTFASAGLTVTYYRCPIFDNKGPNSDYPYAWLSYRYDPWSMPSQQTTKAFIFTHKRDIREPEYAPEDDPMGGDGWYSDYNPVTKEFSSGSSISTSWYSYYYEYDSNLREKEGKGVIYYMKDEFNNEAPYDFKNIIYDTWVFSVKSTEQVNFIYSYIRYKRKDLVVNGTNLYAWKRLCSAVTELRYTLSETPAAGTNLVDSSGAQTTSIIGYSIDLRNCYTFCYSHNNINNSKDASIVGLTYFPYAQYHYCTNNKIELTSSKTSSAGCYDAWGNYFSSVSSNSGMMPVMTLPFTILVGNDNSYTQMLDNIFTNTSFCFIAGGQLAVKANSFKDCYKLSLNGSVSHRIFQDTYTSILTNEVVSSTIEHMDNSAIIGKCYYNRLLRVINLHLGNTDSSTASNNSLIKIFDVYFGDNATNLTISDSMYIYAGSRAAPFLDNCQNIQIDSDCAYITINSSTSLGSSDKLKNIHIHSGIKGTGSNYKVITETKNLDHVVDYYPAGSETKEI